MCGASTPPPRRRMCSAAIAEHSPPHSSATNWQLNTAKVIFLHSPISSSTTHCCTGSHCLLQLGSSSHLAGRADGLPWSSPWLVRLLAPSIPQLLSKMTSHSLPSSRGAIVPVSDEEVKEARRGEPSFCRLNITLMTLGPLKGKALACYWYTARRLERIGCQKIRLTAL
jgi:hypothetical protein